MTLSSQGSRLSAFAFCLVTLLVSTGVSAQEGGAPIPEVPSAGMPIPEATSAGTHYPGTAYPGGQYPPMQNSGMPYAGAPYPGMQEPQVYEQPVAPTWGLNRPGVHARAGALFLFRGDNRSQSLLANAAGTTLLDAAALDFDFQTGWDVAGGYNFKNCWGIDTRVFRLDGFNANTTVTDLGSVPALPGMGLVIVNDQVIGVFGGGATPSTGNVNLGTELTSVELNVRRSVLDGDLSFITGFRYLNLQDNLGITLLKGGIDQSFFIDTQNDLFGVQLGGTARLIRGTYFSLDATTLGGVYGNQSQLSINNQSVAYGYNVTTSTDSSGVSFAGELDLTAGIHLTSNLKLLIGYQLMWLSSVASGVDQPSVNNISTVPLAATEIDRGSDVFFQGGMASLEFRR